MIKIEAASRLVLADNMKAAAVLLKKLGKQKFPGKIDFHNDSGGVCLEFEGTSWKDAIAWLNTLGWKKVKPPAGEDPDSLFFKKSGETLLLTLEQGGGDESILACWPA